MSTNSQIISLSTLKFLKPADLANSLKQSSMSDQVAVVDVRDNDHLGGHIKSSQWIPINQLDARMPEVLRVNKDKKSIVFHCMLSQQRGPKAALAYARARAARLSKERKEEAETEGAEQDESTEVVDSQGRVGGQEICVLEGGFDNWQRSYGEDETLTEGYVKDLW